MARLVKTSEPNPEYVVNFWKDEEPVRLSDIWPDGMPDDAPWFLLEKQAAHAQVERNWTILRMRSCGETLQEIGDRFGFTRERSRELVIRVSAIVLRQYAAGEIDGPIVKPDTRTRLEREIDSLREVDATSASIRASHALRQELLVWKSEGWTHNGVWVPVGPSYLNSIGLADVPDDVLERIYGFGEKSFEAVRDRYPLTA